MVGYRWIAPVTVALALLWHGVAGAVTLDREGKLPPPPYYTCHNSFDFKGAGGKPYFEIQLEAWCGAHPADGIPGWTPVDWKRVAIFGRYNYDTGVTEEQVWLGPDVLLEVSMTCSANPWAHFPDCSLTQPVVNNTHTVVNGPFPVSAYRIPHSLRTSLENWEQTPSTESLLADFDPLGGPQPAPKVKVVSPTTFPVQVFPENATGFELDVDSTSGDNNAMVPATLEIEWHQLEETPTVVGDIAMPADKTHWWQPLSFPAPTLAQWSDFPLSLANYFAGKPGHYKVRVRGKFIDDGWSSEVKFQIGDPGFDLPQSEQTIIAAAEAFKLLTSPLDTGNNGDGARLLSVAPGHFNAKAMNRAKGKGATPAGQWSATTIDMSRRRSLARPAAPALGASSKGVTKAPLTTRSLTSATEHRISPVPRTAKRPADVPGRRARMASTSVAAAPKRVGVHAAARFALQDVRLTGRFAVNQAFMLKAQVRNTGKAAGTPPGLDVRCQGCQVEPVGNPGSVAPGGGATLAYAVTPSRTGRQFVEVHGLGASQRTWFAVAAPTKVLSKSGAQVSPAALPTPGPGAKRIGRHPARLLAR